MTPLTHSTQSVRRVLLPVVMLLGAGLSGCAVQTDQGLMTAQPLTTSTVEETTIESAPAIDLPGTIAVLPLNNQTDSELGVDAVRQTLSNHFGSRNYRVLHTVDVDRRLTAAGIETFTNQGQDLDQLRSALGVDGLILGDVTHYEKTFAGVGARISVGVSLQFYNAANELIWEVSDIQRSYAGGVSASPVGLIVNALAAAKHLYGDINLFRAADDLGRTLAKQMPAPAVLTSDNRPTITNVAHSGVGQRLNYGDELEFGLEGDPGLSASIAISGLGLIDLKEGDPGQYSGAIIVDQSINLEKETVIGRLMNPDGAFSAWVSPYGLLTIDNTPPASLKALDVTSRNQGAQIRWAIPKDQDIKHIMVTRSESGETRLLAPDAESVAIDGLVNFRPENIDFILEDTAGNRTQTQRIRVIAASDPRYNGATDIKGPLPSVIRGSYRLRSEFSPYQLKGSIQLAEDGVLFIEPNVKLALAADTMVEVLGELHAMGTSEQPIVISQLTEVPANQFLVLRSNQPSSLSGLKISGVNVPIQILAGAPIVEDSSIDGAFNAVMVSGSAKPRLMTNKISNASASGIVISEQAQPTFEDNTFIENQPFHIQNSSSYAISISKNTFEPPASEITVLGKTED